VKNHSPTRAGGATYCSNAIRKNLAYMLETIKNYGNQQGSLRQLANDPSETDPYVFYLL